nr:helix-turn-helix domain-containing protein [Halobacterium sp. TGN-42-S1]
MSLTRLQVSATLAPRALPSFYVAVTESTAISQLRLVDWNLAAEDLATVLYDVDGDSGVFADAARGTDGIKDVAVPTSTGGSRWVLVTADPGALPFFRTFLVLTARAGLLVRSPVAYSDFETRGEVIGDASALQAAVDAAPRAIDVTIENVGSRPSVRADAFSELSDRQREAVVTAFEHGYYRHPRETTHAELAEELGCAANTVSEHLQKAEVKLITAVVERQS